MAPFSFSTLDSDTFCIVTTFLNVQDVVHNIANTCRGLQNSVASNRRIWKSKTVKIHKNEYLNNWTIKQKWSFANIEILGSEKYSILIQHHLLWLQLHQNFASTLKNLTITDYCLYNEQDSIHNYSGWKQLVFPCLQSLTINDCWRIDVEYFNVRFPNLRHFTCQGTSIYTITSSVFLQQRQQQQQQQQLSNNNLCRLHTFELTSYDTSRLNLFLLHSIDSLSLKCLKLTEVLTRPLTCTFYNVTTLHTNSDVLQTLLNTKTGDQILFPNVQNLTLDMRSCTISDCISSMFLKKSNFIFNGEQLLSLTINNMSESYLLMNETWLIKLLYHSLSNLTELTLTNAIKLIDDDDADASIRNEFNYVINEARLPSLSQLSQPSPRPPPIAKLTLMDVEGESFLVVYLVYLLKNTLQEVTIRNPKSQLYYHGMELMRYYDNILHLPILQRLDIDICSERGLKHLLKLMKPNHSFPTIVWYMKNQTFLSEQQTNLRKAFGGFLKHNLFVNKCFQCEMNRDTLPLFLDGICTFQQLQVKDAEGEIKKVETEYQLKLQVAQEICALKKKEANKAIEEIESYRSNLL